ncbi:hypothetical protein PROFUN_16332, partial [Planoprotostelium fungivorum]
SSFPPFIPFTRGPRDHIEIISSPLEAASLAYKVCLPLLEDIQMFYKVLLPVIRDVSVPYSPEWKDLIKIGLLSTFIDEGGRCNSFLELSLI